MITLLKRYIAKTIVSSTLLTALVIISVLFIITLLGELKNMGEGDYGLIQAFVYVMLRLPNDIYQFSPMLVLLGSIVGLSILSSHRELSVMRAAGFSIHNIVYATLSIALMIILVISLMGESLAPMLSRKAEMHKENAQNAGQAVVTATGVWFHVDNNFIHVQHVIGRSLLEGVTRYQFDDLHQLQVAYYAKTLTYQNKQWVMNDVVKTEFYHDRTRSQAYPQANWDVKLNANLLNVGQVNPNDMSLPRLFNYSHYLEQNGLQASAYKHNFWQRIFQPLASLIMIFLALPFVLSTLSTTTLGWRLVVGVMVGFAFFILNALLGQVCIVYQVPVLFAALLPLVVFGLVGVVMMRSMVRR
jgi:lipopolysaccharide export system permease protein